MDIKQLLEKMEEFAGEKVGQKPGDQWRGKDAAPPGKKLVGASESVLKDLSKGPTAKTREQELSEEFQAFLEAEFQDTVDKRPARKNARHSRGHEPQPRYKTIKTEEGAETSPAALADPIVATVVKQMRPGLTGLDMGNEAFLYFAYELGKQRARDAWSDYLPAIRHAYEQGLNEDANTDNKLAKLLTRFINQHEGTDRAVALDAIEYIKKIGHIEQFATSLDYFAVDLDEGLEEDNSVEARWMVKVSDDEGDHLKTYHRKFPSLSAAKKAYKNTPYASDFKYKPVKKDQVEEAVVGQDTFNRAGYNPISDERDYLDKLSKLSNLYRQQGLDQSMKDQIFQRINDLNAEARKKGYIQAESRGQNIISTKLKNLERERKFASGELKIPTPQERQAQLAKQQPKKEKVDEYGADNPAQATTQKASPAQAQQVAANLNTQKTALSQLKQINPEIDPQKAAMAVTKDVATMSPQEKEELAQVAKTLSPALGTSALGSIKTAIQKSQLQAKK